MKDIRYNENKVIKITKKLGIESKKDNLWHLNYNKDGITYNINCDNFKDGIKRLIEIIGD